jgi:hypothetical protein
MAVFTREAAQAKLVTIVLQRDCAHGKRGAELVLPAPEAVRLVKSGEARAVDQTDAIWIAVADPHRTADSFAGR